MLEPERYHMKTVLIEEMVRNQPSSVQEQIRKKPVIVEAMQLTGFGPHDIEVYMWAENYVGGFGPVTLRGESKGISVDSATGFMLIATPKGVIEAEPGDYIVRGVTGDFRPMKSDIFRATYDSATIDNPKLYPEKVNNASI